MIYLTSYIDMSSFLLLKEGQFSDSDMLSFIDKKADFRLLKDMFFGMQVKEWFYIMYN